MSRLVLRDAVCNCHLYCGGFRIETTPSPLNGLPLGMRCFIDSKPFVCTRRRQHLQFESTKLDCAIDILEAAMNRGQPRAHLCPEKGSNYCDTPCTSTGGFIRAGVERLRIGQQDRPWRIAPRHHTGYVKELQSLYGVLTAIVRQKKDLVRPDPSTRYEKYSGEKKLHYQRCAAEHYAHPLGTRAGAQIFHAGAVKWGELSARPRALLVQSVRAKGADGVKPGTLLRLPIAIEGGYRDHYEDALHHYCHSRGYHYVASGMDLHKRGRKMDQMIEPGDLVLACDWSSFDGSLGWLGVEERNAFLAECEKLFGRDNALREVIKTQNRCTFQFNECRGAMFGNRGSGTAGTSTGNKIVVLAALRYALGPAMRGRSGVKLFCDGDDTLIIVPRRWQQRPDHAGGWVSSWVSRLTKLGLETKVEQNILDEPAEPALPQVRFCRAGVIDTSRGKFLCKNPLDAIKVMTNFRRHFRGPQFRNYIQTLSVGMSNVYGDVPILHKFAEMFDVGGKFDAALYDSAGMEYMIQRHKSGTPGAIDERHRDSFFLTWGVTPSEQRACEALMDEVIQEFKRLVADYH